jgi:2-polyprenyl-6-methoxyphenol hydroxylase-like FAD-dependent oxidoreductase
MAYDVIVVGARCAGAPLAMLLARRGARVLVVDRARFPSDTISTHLIHPPGVAALERWGLLDAVVATGCPAIHTYAMDMGPFTIAAPPGPPENPVSYGPRRTVLDALLVEAAAQAGAEIRQGFVVEGVLRDDGRVCGVRGRDQHGRAVEERGQVVVGADGRHSIVARSVRPHQYNDKPQLQAGYYTYWSGLPVEGRFEAFDRGDRAWAAWPTNDGLTLVVVSWPFAQFETNRHEIEQHYLEALDRAPAFRERVRSARREDRFLGTAVPNFLRKPYGPGWALAGDAGYLRDFITAQGISDAFRDAELCAAALGAFLDGTRDYDSAMAAYHAERDAAVLPMYEFTAQFARLGPPPPEMQQLMAAIHGNLDATCGFIRVVSGCLSPATFFAEDNVRHILGAGPATAG